jgi:hypothetical protein
MKGMAELWDKLPTPLFTWLPSAFQEHYPFPLQLLKSKIVILAEVTPPKTSSLPRSKVSLS